MRDKILQLTENYWKKKNNKSFSPGVDQITVTEKVINHEEIKYMVDAALDGWLTTGRFNKIFETKLAEALGSKLVITVNSGSSANLVALSALASEKIESKRRINFGDEVITVAAGFPTTVNPIIQIGAIPVFIDISLSNFNIDINLIKKSITKKTKAIMVAHTLGNPYDVKKIKKICEEFNIWLVQDSCDALGCEVDGKKLGFYGDIGSVSFYPAHHITTGEGGAVFTNSMKLKRIAESIRDWGRDCYCEPGKDNTCKKRYCWKLGKLPYGYDHKYTYTHLGYNLKMTDMQASCGVAQLKKLPKFIKARRDNYNYLKKNLDFLKKDFFFCSETPNAKASWFGFLINIKKTSMIKRNDIIEYLDKKKVATRLLFGGNLTKQPYLINRKFKKYGSLKNTDFVMNNSFWIGIHPGLDKKKLDYVIKIFKEFYKKY